MIDDIRSRLAAAVASLRATDQARAEQLVERDRLIREARDEGLTWAEIGELTGLAKQAVAMALKRGL